MDTPPPNQHPVGSARGAAAAPAEELVLTDASDDLTHAGWLLAQRPEARIVLVWLVRLRWLALAGQLAAVAAAMLVFRFDLPLVAVLTIIAITALTNIVLASWVYTHDYRMAGTPGWVLALLLLDVLLLTGLLAATGGPANPFTILYVIHVAMAVLVLSAAWTWVIVGASIACYGVLMLYHVPLHALGTLPPGVFAAGGWVALSLTCVLIAYFIGRLASSLRQREQQVSGMREMVLRSERLASLTTLAAGAAHELGTPLATIALVARELERSASADKPNLAGMVEDAQLIRSQVDRCRTILDRMNVENTGGAEQPASVMLAPMLEAIREEVRPEQAPQLQIRLEPGLTHATLPRQAVIQALVILVHNALDASQEKRTPVTLAVERHHQRLRFVVTDRGSGMTREMLQRAGEPFVTTKDPGRGMGLGLFLVRLLAEQLRGTLRIWSQPGTGTRATLEFPEPGP